MRSMMGFLLLLFLLVAACTGIARVAENGGESTRGIVAAPDPVQAALDAGAPVKELRLTAKRFAFTPAVITVNEGDVVRLAITSEDVNHGLALPVFGVIIPVPAGESHTVTFIADRKGEFPFYCSVYCGEGHGSMRGILVVE